MEWIYIFYYLFVFWWSSAIIFFLFFFCEIDKVYEVAIKIGERNTEVEEDYQIFLKVPHRIHCSSGYKCEVEMMGSTGSNIHHLRKALPSLWTSVIHRNLPSGELLHCQSCISLLSSFTWMCSDTLLFLFNECSFCMTTQTLSLTVPFLASSEPLKGLSFLHCCIRGSRLNFLKLIIGSLCDALRYY